MQQRLMAEFRQTRENCLWTYRKFIMDNPWISRKELKTRAEDFHPVYIPCSVFDGRVEGDLEFSARTHTQDEQHDYYNSFVTTARLAFTYEKVQISRVTGFPSRCIQVNPEDLAAYSAEKVGQAEILPAEGTPETAAEQAKEQIAADARTHALQELSEKHSPMRFSAPNPGTIEKMATVSCAGEALLPAWVLSRDNQNIVIINGITGEIWADPPMNFRRFLLTGAYVSLFAAGLVYLLLWFVLNGNYHIPLQGWILPVAALAFGLPVGFLIARIISSKRRAHAAGSEKTQFGPRHKGVKVLKHMHTRTRKVSKDDN